MSPSIGRVVTMGDLHYPFIDRKAFQVALKVITVVRPGAIVLNGDNLDCYQISRFSQDPQRKTQLQKDIDGLRSCLTEIKSAAPEANLYYTEGNHEARLTTFKWNNPELSSLDTLTIPSLLNLKGLGIEWISAKERLTFGDWQITHGALARLRSGYTAHGMIDRYGCSGVSNHVHRLAQVTRRMVARELTWIENGCLCELDMEYVANPDWSHGFSVLHGSGNKVFSELVHIRDRRTIYQGNEFRA